MNNDTELEALKKKLLLCEQRFNIAMGFSDVTVFEYDILTKKIYTQPVDFETFGLPAIVNNGVEDMIASGIVAKRSHDVMRELYRKIDAGEPSAKATIYAKANDDSERVVELFLVNIFDDSGKPVCAVGVRKDVTDALLAQKERKYSETIMSDWFFIYEANVTRDRIIRYDEKWSTRVNVSDVASYSKMVLRLCELYVAPECIDSFKAQMTEKNILDCYNNGQLIISIEYLRKTDDGGALVWYKQSVNIIEEEITGDINIRVYAKNINEEKHKELKLQEEQHYYEAMVQKSATVYEVNATKGTLIAGFEEWGPYLTKDVNDDYMLMFTKFCDRAVHPDERDDVKAMFSLPNVLKEYAAGTRELVCEYRRSSPDGDLVWVSCTMHLYEEPLSGDIKGYCYVQDIDAQKKEQLALIYKSQHDALTGFFNKSTLEDEVTEYLSTSDAKCSSHAFFILDLDFFKQVNDTFGHAFGDVFLSQAASKIGALFRENDILGRVGGDEFVVFMKNIQSEHAACVKAAELCATLTENFTQNGIVLRVSVSIGIALYKKHGNNFAELYRHSDAALYSSKEHGRAQYTIYDESMTFGETNVKAIDNERLLQPKVFKENISEYVFRILYEAVEEEQSINLVLELIGKHYGNSRIYIYENSPDNLTTRNTFGWCADGVKPHTGSGENPRVISLKDYHKRFNADGYFFVSSIEIGDKKLNELLAPDNIKSMLQFSIVKNNKFLGFLGLDQCNRPRAPTQDELRDCRNMANVIGIFITEMRARQAAIAAKKESDIARHNSEMAEQMAMSVVNGLGSYTYVCDEATKKILFINSQLKKLLPDAHVGDLCHKAFWGSESPCEGCPVYALISSGEQTYTKDMFNTNLNMWVNVTTSWISWLGSKRVCLVDSVDITKYMESGKQKPL